jgi:hypothetical protein
MQVTTKPKCPEYFKLSKTRCECVLPYENLDKIKKRKTKKKDDRIKLKHIDFNMLSRSKTKKCPKGMFFDKINNQCEFNELKKERQQEIKVLKQKERENIKRQKEREKKYREEIKKKEKKRLEIRKKRERDIIKMEKLKEQEIKKQIKQEERERKKMEKDIEKIKKQEERERKKKEKKTAKLKKSPKKLNKTFKHVSPRLLSKLFNLPYTKKTLKKKLNFSNSSSNILNTPKSSVLDLSNLTPRSFDSLDVNPDTEIIVTPRDSESQLLKTLYSNIKQDTRKKTKTNKTIKKKINFIESSEILEKIDSLSKQLTSVHSFSPEINKQLLSMKTDIKTDLDDCNTLESKGIPKIRVDGRCMPFTDETAQEMLLANLSSKDKINCDKIIAPKQILANCWFNTMFVTLFISDKGRKFFKFFRQLMITGKTLDNKNIDTKLHNALFRLNLAIESCLGSGYGTNNYVRDLALKINTNTLIRKIYNSIPSKYHEHNIKKVGAAGNPISYYQSIINYLGDKSINLLLIDDVKMQLNNGDDWMSYLETKMYNKLNSELPDVIVLEFFDEGNKERAFKKNKRSTKPLNFLLKGNTHTAKFVLDSAVIRDTQQEHFCSTLTCNKSEYGFDGASFSRLSKFKWKNLINTDKKWTFTGSLFDNKKPIEWNFREGYQLLFYYRE